MVSFVRVFHYIHNRFKPFKMNTLSSFWSLLLLALLAFSCNNGESGTDLPNPDPEAQEEEAEQGYRQYGSPFLGVPEPEDVVMYEVNLRAFSPGGDIQGVTERLDHIRSLGVNVIWLMPIYPIGIERSVNSPYCVRDYRSVDPEFGTLSDLRTLVDGAHDRGMAVILDWVANHTSWDHDWINNTDWYTEDEDGNIVHPPGTNWEDVADLNYGSTEMRTAMIDAMLYWLYEANVDGFRCDYADGVPADFWTRAAGEIRSIPDREFILFAEGERRDHFDSGFDLAFGWDFYHSVKTVFDGASTDELYAAHEREYTGIPQDKHWIRFTTNHDESAWDATPVALFGGIDGATAASAIAIFTGGAPLIYGSQEVGTASNIPFFSQSTIDWTGNPEMKANYEAMMGFYNDSEAARLGVNAMHRDRDVYCLKKELDGDQVWIVVNVRNRQETLTVPLDMLGEWTDVLKQEPLLLSGTLGLEPYGILLLD